MPSPKGAAIQRPVEVRPLKDYVTGFSLLLENQIRIGDVVEAGGKAGLAALAAALSAAAA